MGKAYSYWEAMDLWGIPNSNAENNRKYFIWLSKPELSAMLMIQALPVREESRTFPPEK